MKFSPIIPTLKRADTQSSQCSSAPLRPKSYQGFLHIHPPPVTEQEMSTWPAARPRRKHRRGCGGMSFPFAFPWHIFTTSRVLHASYALLALCVLASGIVLTIFALLWMYPDSGSSPSNAPALVTLIVTQLDIYAALIVGILLACTALMSVPCLISTSINGMYVLNTALWFDIVASLGGAAIIWWRSLRPRVTFGALWDASYDDLAKGTIQDRFGCCGYWNAELVVTSVACPSEDIALTRPACVDAFTDHANGLLGGVSTFVWGVVGMLAIWILVNSCIVSFRYLERRFVLIDRKKGRGVV